MAALAIPGAIEVLLIALVASYLIWAARPLFRPLLQALTQIPFAGAFIAGRLEALLSAVVSSGSSWAQAALQPLSQLFHDLLWGWFQFRDATWQATDSLLNAHWRTVALRLPALENRVTGYAQRLYYQAVAYATQVEVDVSLYAEALYRQAVAYAAAVGVAAGLYALGLYRQAVAFALALYSQAVGFALALQAQALAFALALYSQAVAYAQQLEVQALDFASLLYRQAVAFAALLYSQAVGYAQRIGVQGQLYSDALYRAAIAYAAATSAAVLARVITLERSRCQQFCEPLGDVGNLIQQVEDLGLALGLLGLAVEAFHDPRGTARAVDDLIGGEVRDLVQAIPRDEGIPTAA